MTWERVPSADGTPIAFRRRGDGAPVLFVHGGGTDSGDWSFVRRHLQDRFEVVTMDRRGRGASGDGPEYAIEREAEDVVAVLDATGAELLVGHSYGAMCCILALQRTARVRRFVMYEPPIAYRGHQLEELEDRVARGDIEPVLTAHLQGVGTQPEQLDAIRRSPAWPVLLAATPALARELRACVRWHNPADRIDVPTLYLIGAETASPTYLDTLDELLAAFRDIRRVEIPGQQHVAHVFAAEAFAELVGEFLAQPAAQP